MNWFQYNYKTSNEILELIPQINEFWFLDIIGLWLSIWLTTLLIFFVIPISVISYTKYKKTKNTKNKRKLLTQILLRKEIEDEVESEIKIEEEETVV